MRRSYLSSSLLRAVLGTRPGIALVTTLAALVAMCAVWFHPILVAGIVLGSVNLAIYAWASR